jgi:hypothetical protein
MRKNIYQDDKIGYDDEQSKTDEDDKEKTL